MSDFFAIDIGHSTIKLVQASRDGDKVSLEAIGGIDFPQNLESVVPEKENDEKVQLLASVIKNLVESSGVKINQVVASLPENLVFSKFTTVPYLDPAKLEETIFWEARQFIPIPLEEAQMDWIEIRRNEGATKGSEMVDVMIIAAPKKSVESYLYLFEQAGLELLGLEVESVSTARAITYNYEGLPGNNIFIDIGFDKTNVGVTFNGKLIFSQSISNGSNALTKVIGNDFGLQVVQAEQYKNAYGLLQNQADHGKISNSIRPIVDLILSEIKKVVGFVNTRLNFGTMQKIYLTGGGALTPGMAEYVQSVLGMPTEIVNPFLKVKLGRGFENIMNEIPVSGFTLALGLAIKDE